MGTMLAAGLGGHKLKPRPLRLNSLRSLHFKLRNNEPKRILVILNACNLGAINNIKSPFKGVKIFKREQEKYVASQFDIAYAMPKGVVHVLVSLSGNVNENYSQKQINDYITESILLGSEDDS